MASIHVEDHSREAIDAKNAAILRFLTEAGLHLEGEAKEELEVSPKRVDTGLLRNSIAFALDGEAASIQTYHADRPKKGSTVIESGSYSGTTPEEPQGKNALYVGTNVEYGVYV